MDSSLIHLPSVFKKELYLRFNHCNEVTKITGSDSRLKIKSFAHLPIIVSSFFNSMWERGLSAKAHIMTTAINQRNIPKLLIICFGIFVLIDIKHPWDILTYHETEDSLLGVVSFPGCMNLHKYIPKLCLCVYVNICSSSICRNTFAYHMIHEKLMQDQIRKENWHVASRKLDIGFKIKILP